MLEFFRLFCVVLMVIGVLWLDAKSAHPMAVWTDDTYLKKLGKQINEINKANGWRITTTRDWREPYKIPACLALITSEVSEALEEFRKPEQNREAFTEELADVVIRVLDLSSGLNLDLDKAVHQKLVKNRTRGFRHGGKRV